MKHTLCKQFKVGQEIVAPLYDMRAYHRFSLPIDIEKPNARKLISPTPNPIACLPFACFVVGFRRAIMRDYAYNAGHEYAAGFEEPYPEYEPPSAHGKTEECLVVVKKGSTRFQPFLVRPKEIVL